MPCSDTSILCYSISQWLELLDHLHSMELPLQLERVVEVTHKEWTLKPVANKHPRLADLDKREGEGGGGFTRKYICRPSHLQQPHTGES